MRQPGHGRCLHKEVPGVRKAFVLLSLGVIITLLAVLVPGCGQSSDDLALRYIGRGDGYSYRMASEGERR